MMGRKPPRSAEAEQLALPRSVAAIEERRDQWNRRTYRLAIDAGTIREIRSSAARERGVGYLDCGPEPHPRPVDPLPLMLGLDELGDVPAWCQG